MVNNGNTGAGQTGSRVRHLSWLARHGRHCNGSSIKLAFQIIETGDSAEVDALRLGSFEAEKLVVADAPKVDHEKQNKDVGGYLMEHGS